MLNTWNKVVLFMLCILCVHLNFGFNVDEICISTGMMLLFHIMFLQMTLFNNTVACNTVLIYEVIKMLENYEKVWSFYYVKIWFDFKDILTSNCNLYLFLINTHTHEFHHNIYCCSI